MGEKTMMRFRVKDHAWVRHVRQKESNYLIDLDVDDRRAVNWLLKKWIGRVGN